MVKKDDESLFEQAKWLRETRRLYGAGAIRKKPEHITINLEGRTVDIASLDRRVEELDSGLDPEEEFLALSTWMGNCLAIHKLGQELYPPLARQDYVIPDYLAVYKYKGRPVTVLVEVKSTFGEKELEFTTSYYEKLSKYAEFTKLPLLIAWKYKDYGFWCLFELGRMRKKVSAFYIEFFEALKSDLMSILLGSILITVKAGTRFVMNLEKLRQESPNSFEGIVRDVYWATSEGVRISPTPRHFMLFFSQCEDEVEVKQDEKTFTQTFFTTQDWAVIGYKTLSTALEFRRRERERIEWMQVVRAQSFPVTYADIVKTAEEGLRNGLTRYIIHQQPAIIPKFLASVS